MKKSYVLAVAFSTALYCAPVFAQHGHGVGGGGGMGPTMSANGSSHANSNASSASHGTTISSGSSTKVLDNSHVTTALTNALTKSGITIPGGDLKATCSTFKNLGQCIAALHVAKNLNLTFSDLQTKMGSESLGKAIHDLGGPNVNATSEAKKGNKQANQDLKDATSNS